MHVYIRMYVYIINQFHKYRLKCTIICKETPGILRKKQREKEGDERRWGEKTERKVDTTETTHRCTGNNPDAESDDEGCLESLQVASDDGPAELSV